MKPVYAMCGLVAVLAGCAALGAPQPATARLSSDRLTVTLTDGTICRVPWAAGFGRMDRCGPGLDWRVEVDPNPNPLRQAFEGLTGALGLDGIVVPLAEVTLTDPQGRVFIFASPPPVDMN